MQPKQLSSVEAQSWLDRTCSSMSNWCPITLGSGKFGGHVDALSSLSTPSSHSWAVFSAVSGLTAIGEYCYHEGQYLFHSDVSHSIQMNASTQGFPGGSCNVTRQSVLFTSPVSGFHVVTDRFIENKTIFSKCFPFFGVMQQQSRDLQVFF